MQSRGTGLGISLCEGKCVNRVAGDLGKLLSVGLRPVLRPLRSDTACFRFLGVKILTCFRSRDC